MDNKNNLKWIVQYVLLVAIICCGLSILAPKKELNQQAAMRVNYRLQETVTAFPEAFKLYMQHRNEEHYWDSLYDTFRQQEERNPTIIGSIILSMEEKKCTENKLGTSI